MTSHLLFSTPAMSERIWASSGEETEKVVAVPAISANTARMSTNFPAGPSVRVPRIGRQDSENFCFFRFLTYSMKPKQADSTA